jgi:hypothetical protein
MKSELKFKIIATVYVIALIVSFIPMVYWWNHPELTKMELFKEFWELYTTIIVIFSVGQYIIIFKSKY